MNDTANNDNTPEMVAAVDLGSNSFHMIVARLEEQQLVIVDRLRESVRLGAGLRSDKSLAKNVRERALDCLSRFGQRLRNLPHGAVRAVGTNTMRQIRDDGAFLKAAGKALGHPIEIIAGREEARLVYLGVAHGLATGEDTRLVIDIGGGSTELILGQGMTPGERESLYMGCVSMSRRYFDDGLITEKSMNRAMLAGAIEIRPVRRHFNAGNWQSVVGSSGTIRSIQKVVKENGWSEEGITQDSLRTLRRKLIETGSVDGIDLPGLSEERKPVFAGGVAVLSALFDSLNIEKMLVSDLALREGLLYELVGYIQHHDVRDRTVDSLSKRFGLDHEHAQRVEMTATALLSQVAREWDLTNPEHGMMLGWACRLHEIGLILSHNGFHKHGAYILENSDLPGFSRQQQSALAALVRHHRRKFGSSLFDELPKPLATAARRLCLLLRLAVLMHRGRSPDQKPMLFLDVHKNQVKLSFPEGWLAEHPLTVGELEREIDFLKNTKFDLSFS